MTDFRARHSPVTYTPEEWPGTIARIGMILLSVDHATEPEILRMTPPGVAQFFASRIPIPSPCTVENLQAMGPELTATARLLLPGSPLDAVMYSCTSGATVIGPTEVDQRIAAALPGVPVTSPITAAVRAFRHLGVTQPAVLTPYIDEVNARIDQHLRAQGLAPAAFDSFHLQTDAEMSAVPPDAILAAALAADTASADCLFVCCTALRPSTVVDMLEQKAGKPVVTSHQAMLWDALRQAGHAPSIPGQGQLLRG